MHSLEWLWDRWSRGCVWFHLSNQKGGIEPHPEREGVPDVEIKFIFGRCLETSHCSSLRGHRKVLEGSRKGTKSGSCRLRDGSFKPWDWAWCSGTGWGAGRNRPGDSHFLLWVPGGPALRQKHKRKRGWWVRQLWFSKRQAILCLQLWAHSHLGSGGLDLIALYQCFSTGSSLDPQGTFENMWRHFDRQTWEGGEAATSI